MLRVERQRVHMDWDIAAESGIVICKPGTASVALTTVQSAKELKDISKIERLT